VRFKVVNLKGQNLVFIVLIAALLVIILFHFKPETRLVLAQAGGKVGNAVAVQNQGENEPAFVPVNEAAIEPQSDGSGIEVISNSAFRNDGDSVDGWFNLFSGGYIRNNGATTACFMAPTYPPNNATLTQFGISILDQSATTNLQFVRLHRVNLTTGAVDVMAGGLINWNDPTAVELIWSAGIAPGTAKVSPGYSYYVDLCFDPSSGADILFYGARLFYNP
jgi:hypothetical protein